MTWGHAVKQTVTRGDLLRSLPSGVPLGWMDGTVEVGRDHMSGGLGCQIGDDLAGRSPPSTSRLTVTILSPVAIGWYMVSVVRPAA